MKKTMVSIGALLFPLILQAGDEPESLRQQLSQIDAFQANFQQQVVDPEGQVIHQAKGELSLSKPAKLNWQQHSPEDDVIISDGETIWYYSPFVEQVTIMDAEQAIAQSPFILLVDNSDASWNSYDVAKQQQGYLLTPKDPATQSTFWVQVQDQTIQAFAIIDGTGQRSEFILSDYELNPLLDQGLFNFAIPDNIMVDDQR